MTPYTKKIVELHKIHKAIEEKDCCSGGGNTPSGDITIDDVVKFIHDDIAKLNPALFPYTTWNDIPDYDDANSGDYFKTNINDASADEQEFSNAMLYTPSYIIAKKGGSIGPVG